MIYLMLALLGLFVTGFSFDASSGGGDHHSV